MQKNLIQKFSYGLKKNAKGLLIKKNTLLTQCNISKVKQGYYLVSMAKNLVYRNKKMQHTTVLKK